MADKSDARSFELVTTAVGPDGDTFDPALNPELFDGITIRRITAYVVDFLLISLLMFVSMSVFWVLGILSFGVLSPFLVVLLPFIPLAYHTALIGGSDSATLGMRLFGIESRRIDGGYPGYLQAGLLTVAFYVSVGATGWLILLVALFNGRGRTLHDYLCGTVTIRPSVKFEASIRSDDQIARR